MFFLKLGTLYANAAKALMAAALITAFSKLTLLYMNLIYYDGFFDLGASSAKKLSIFV